MASSSSDAGASREIRRVAILFAGGPAPAANAVISTAAAAFNRHGIEVLGILHGYAHLVEYSPENPLKEGRDYVVLDQSRLRRTRNTRGIMIGTARSNPGKDVTSPKHLADPKRSAGLRVVYQALRSMNVDALVSIGGDDTLKTANKFREYQAQLPASEKRIAVVHVPKTIDNDYPGIDFTFGYFTAVDTIAGEIRNLLADAESNRFYFLVESMGRSAGWLAYGASIAGEASLVISVEDLTESFMSTETATDPRTGVSTERKIMLVDKVVAKIVKVMRLREAENKEFGVVVLAEGLAQFLPMSYMSEIKFDDHGHLSLSQTKLATTMAKLVEDEYTRQTGKKRRMTGVQLGYEARCALPHAFDVVLGSQLGVGAYRALVERNLDGVLISVTGQFALNYVPFSNLIDPETMVTVIRYIEPGSDFLKLARFLENYPHD